MLRLQTSKGTCPRLRYLAKVHLAISLWPFDHWTPVHYNPQSGSHSTNLSLHVSIQCTTREAGAAVDLHRFTPVINSEVKLNVLFLMRDSAYLQHD